MNANDRLLDAFVSHQVLLQQFSNREVRKIVSILADTEARLLDQISKTRTTWSRRRLERMLAQVREILAAAHVLMRNTLLERLKPFTQLEIDFTVRALNAQLATVGLAASAPLLGDLRTAVRTQPFQGRDMVGWFNDLSRSQTDAIGRAVRAGWIEGQTNQQIVQAVRGTRAMGFRDGVLSTGRRQAEAIVRTAINHTANLSRQATFQENSQYFKGVQWVSTLDGRTSSICRARDGNVYPVDSGPRPPAHVNCRSTIMSVLKSWRGLGVKGLTKMTRASMDGQVPADLTYNQWLKRRPRAFIEQVLGKKKAALFVNGELPLTSFVNRRGVELNLSELERLHPEAWARAFN